VDVKKLQDEVSEVWQLVWNGRVVFVKTTLAPGGCQLRGSFGDPPITVVRQGERYWAEVEFLRFFLSSDEYANMVCGASKSTAQKALDTLEDQLQEIESWIGSVRRSGA
jgi:hypothetical protein